MKKENHEEEIRSTRVGGFGGSDAAMLVAIAERIQAGQPLTTTQKHRIRVAKGIETTPPPFTSPEIEAGRAFENEVAKELEKAGWEREQLLSPHPNSTCEPVNFKVFAHADFYDFNTNSVKECKWSRKFNQKGLEKEYRRQLQWYYLLGADSVSLVSDTADGREVSDIKRNDKDVETLRNAVAMLDEAWDKLDLTITEKSCDELPPKVAALVAEIETITKTMAQEEETLKAKKAELLAYMDGNELTKVWIDTASVSYTAPSSSVGFDAKKFEADHADLYAAYRTKITKKAGYLTVKINKNEE